MSQALTKSAIDNVDLLRMVDSDQPPANAAEAAKRLGRDHPANFRRTLERLEADELLQPGSLTLTAQGHRARRALDLAEGLLHVPDNKISVLWSELTPHPDNPRESIGQEELEALADTLEAEGGVLQDLEVTTPDANGVRLILIGHRRWCATKLLVEAGRWPQDTRLSATETKDAPGLIFERSLVENGQRVNLTPLEQARALHKLSLARNWAAPKLAKDTGIHLRVVQESLKVVREADRADIAAHEADPKAFTWERLRDSVKEKKAKPSLDLTPKLALTLVELAYAFHIGPGLLGQKIVIATPKPGGEWSTLRDRNLVEPMFVGDGKMYAQLTAPIFPWLKEIGFQDDPEAALLKARTEVVGPLQASTIEPGRYLTEWLNVASKQPRSERSLTDQITLDRQLGNADDGAASDPPPEEADEGGDADDGGVALYAQLAASTPPPPPVKTPAAAAKADPNAPVLDPYEALIMIEIRHKRDRYSVELRNGLTGVEVGEFMKDAVAQTLLNKRMIGFMPGPKKSFVVYVTPTGEAWLAGEEAQLDLGTARTNADKPEPEEGYATFWLNYVAPASVPLADTLNPTDAQRAQGEAILSAAGKPERIAGFTAGPGIHVKGDGEDVTLHASMGERLEVDAAPSFSGQLQQAIADERAESAEQREAELILGQVKDTTTATPQLLRTLFAAAGIELPLVVEEDTGGFNASILDGSRTARIDCNPDIDITDALGEARARLIVMAVNAACGVEEG